MPKKQAIDQTIQRGVAYLAEQQQADGSFKSFSSPSQMPFQADRTYQTCFVPALILSALAAGRPAGSRPIRNRLATWLAGQASGHQAFNYWAQDAPERQTLPYPDDLDDTFCALSALRLHDKNLIGAPVLAQAVKLLLATETTVGGPYRTWLVPDNAKPVWLDVDLAVNSNIAYFLSLASNPLPNLVKLIDQAVIDDKLASPYYPSDYPISYFIARGYHGHQKPALIKKLEQLLDKAHNALERALCLSSLARLEAPGDYGETLDILVALQAPDGSWPAAAICLDPAISNKTYYHGAASLTTALALEALQLHRQIKPATTRVVRRAGAASGSPSAHRQKILKLAHQQCQPLAADLRAMTISSLDKLATGRDGQEIIGLTEALSHSLPPESSKHSSDMISALSLANLYGWLAYTIYDDFLDEEGKPVLLPVANVAMRNSLDCYRQALPGHPNFNQLVGEIFDVIDGANAWETTHCRLSVQGKRLAIGTLPDYSDLSKLAERSLGHALTPLALLLNQGVSQDSAAFRQLKQAMKHYLIARQLNDDCHDWPDDLRHGHASYAVVKLLTDLDIKPGVHLLSPLLAKMRRHFWRVGLPALCDEMHHHVHLSREALANVDNLKSGNIINRLLDGIEDSIEDTKSQQHQAESFLRQYRREAVAA